MFSPAPWVPPAVSFAPPPAATLPPRQPDPPAGIQPLDVFRALPTPDKDTVRRALGAMGLSTRDFLSLVNPARLPPNAIQRALGTGHEARAASSASSLVGDDPPATPSPHHEPPVPSTPTGPPAAPPTPSPTTGGIPTPPATIVDLPQLPPARHQQLICKPEFLGTYGGDPSRLEAFLLRLRDLVRSETQEHLKQAWEAAVLRALPIALVDDAAVWHEGLSNEEASRLNTEEAWSAAMRRAFPANASRQGKEARERKWSPTEPTTSYYFQKLRALPQAFGDQPDEVLVTDIKDGLPPSLQALLRIPRDGATLDDLVRELGECEPTWREVYHTPLPSDTGTTAKPKPSATTVKTSDPSMVRSASAPTTPAPRAAPMTPRAQQPSPVSLSASYDPGRVTPASHGKPRTYRPPGRDTVMTLNRPCTKCGQDHFNFEHDHLAPQLRTITCDDDDYPEQPLGGGDAEDFTASAMTIN